RLRDPWIHLGARQLPALAGLRALRHLDLQLPSIDEVFARDAEAARGDLLDRRVLRVPVRQGSIALRILAPLARIAASADSVHGDRERLVRFLADRAVRHRPRLEAVHDRLDGLDLLERNGL